MADFRRVPLVQPPPPLKKNRKESSIYLCRRKPTKFVSRNVCFNEIVENKSDGLSELRSKFCNMALKVAKMTSLYRLMIRLGRLARWLASVAGCGQSGFCRLGAAALRYPVGSVTSSAGGQVTADLRPALLITPVITRRIGSMPDLPPTGTLPNRPCYATD